MGKKLSVLDSGWLMMETRESPTHVGGLRLYALPKNAGPDYMQETLRYLLDVPRVCAPFNLKLKSRLHAQRLDRSRPADMPPSLALIAPGGGFAGSGLLAVSDLKNCH